MGRTVLADAEPQEWTPVPGEGQANSGLRAAVVCLGIRCHLADPELDNAVLAAAAGCLPGTHRADRGTGWAGPHWPCACRPASRGEGARSPMASRIR